MTLQLGPVIGSLGGGEYLSVPAAAKPSTGELVLATASVGAGTWLAIYESVSTSYQKWTAQISPGPVSVPGTPNFPTGAIKFGVAQIVTGPATITVTAGPDHRSSAGTLHVARID